MVLVMVNRSPEAEVRAGAITLSEIEETAPFRVGTAKIRGAVWDCT